MTKRSVAIQAVWLASTSVASYALGLLRDRVLAGQFGAGLELDVYNSAFLIPDIIMNIFAAALTTAFIPVFTQLWTKDGETTAWRVTNALLTGLVGLLVVILILAFVTMPWLVYFVAPGFDETGKTLLVHASRLMLLSPLGFGLSIAIGCALQGRHRFFSYALSPVVYNLTIIISIIVLAPKYGVLGVVLGVGAGAFVHAGVRFIELLRTGFKPQLHSPWHEPAIITTIRLMLPRIAGLLAVQANLWIYNALASTLGEGNISIFNFARNFQSLPVSLFGIALATVLFPRLSERFAEDRPQDIVALGQRATTQLLFLTLPATAGMILVAHPLVKLLLGSGEFDDTAVTATSIALMVFALSIPLESIQHILARIFYAQQNVFTPVKIALVGAVINFAVCIIAMQWLGVYGLALGFVVTALSQVLLLQRALYKKCQSIITLPVVGASLKILLASSAMSLVVGGVLWIIKPIALGLGSAIILGVIAYGLCTRWLQIPEFHDTVHMLKTVWQRQFQPIINVLPWSRRRS